MSAREELLRFLQEQGGVFHAPEGNAGPLLAEAIGISYNTVATALYRMERDGVIAREVVGKRTFKITLLMPPNGHARDRIPEPGPLHNVMPGDVDYDEVAAALLRRVVSIDTRYTELVEEVKELRRKVERLLSEKAELQKKLEKTPARLSTLEAEREDLERQLVEANNLLVTLRNELENEKGKRKGTRVYDRISEEDREKLARIMRERPTGRG